MLRDTQFTIGESMEVRVREAPDGQAPHARRIFIQGINYPPELIGAGRYTGEIAEHLAQQGHKIEVVTAVPHYPGWWVRPPYRSFRYYREWRKGVKVTYCPILLHRGGRGIWRLLMPMTFAIAAAPVTFWRILCFRPDVVVCIVPTTLSAPVAILAAKILGARCVLHMHDLELDAAFAVGHLSGRYLKRLGEAVERFLIRRFDVIVTLSERMRERLKTKRPNPKATIEVVRNWADTEKLFPLTGPNQFRQELGLNDDDFVVLYAGQIGAKQALHVVLDAARQLKPHRHIHFVVAGDGPLKSELIACYSLLKNVHFLPLQPDERLCELLNLANLHILPQDRHAEDLVLPSKLGGMLATQRPILVTANQGSELHTIMKDVGIVVPTGDVRALVDGILAATKSNFDVVRLSDLAELFSRQRNLLALQQAICS